MKIQCEREKLVAAIQTCQRVISTKSMLPILSGILLKNDSKSLYLSASDLEASVRTSIKVVSKEKGSLVVPAKLISDILNSLEDEMVELSFIKEKGQLEILGGESRFDLNVFLEEDFPKIPESKGSPIFVIATGTMNSIVKEVIKAASRDDAKPILTGVLVEANKDTIKMVATDSYRLAVGEEKIENGPEEPIFVLVPARTMRELSRIISSSKKKDVAIYLTDSQIIFKTSNTEIISRLIEGEFPNYKQILPKGYEKKIRVNKSRLIGAAKRAALLAQNNTPVKITSGNNTMVISANTQDVGEAIERLDVEYPGEEVKMAFNPVYFMDGITSVEEDEVIIEVSDPLKPALIKPVEKKGFKYLIMPIRLS